MPYVYERSNALPILAGKDDFLNYLPRYVEYWKDFKTQYPSKHTFLFFDVSFLDARFLKNFLSERQADVETFAGVFYALTLFSQVVYHYEYDIWGRDAPTPRQESEDFKIFQTVTGVLATSWIHICPAVMPSMLLYIDPDYAHGKLASNSISGETTLWRKHGDIFDRGVQLVLENIDYLTNARVYGGLNPHFYGGIGVKHAWLESISDFSSVS
jgi:hypothetical protein